MTIGIYDKLWEACHALDWGDPARREIIYIIYVARVKTDSMITNDLVLSDQWDAHFQEMIRKQLFEYQSQSVVAFFATYGIVY